MENLCSDLHEASEHHLLALFSHRVVSYSRARFMSARGHAGRIYVCWCALTPVLTSANYH